MAGVGSAHHVLGVPHLLGQLGHREGAVLLAAARGQGGEAHHEEVQAGEGDQVHRQLAQVSVQLACMSQNQLLSDSGPLSILGVCGTSFSGCCQCTGLGMSW